MALERLISIITSSGTGTRIGLSADDHLDNLRLEIKPANLGDNVPDFRSEVQRKVLENIKPIKEEE